MSRIMDMRRRKGDYWMLRRVYEDRKILRKNRAFGDINRNAKHLKMLTYIIHYPI
jgi:hypothetical protein